MKQLAATASLILAFGVAGAAFMRAMPNEKPTAPSDGIANQTPKCCQERAALDASNCGFCTKEDCKQECSSCTEARKQNTAGQTAPKATQEGVRGMGHGRGKGHGMGRGHAADSQHAKDHQDFFYLLEHRDAIRRTVNNLPNGYEARTESDDPQVAKMIQVHVAAMYNRVENGNPIRMRDPIFRSIFTNADKIQMEVERTERGVRVKETSTDAYGVKLLQEHARVVSLWIKNGYAELPKNHPAPTE